jgi:hypothetical protein
VYKVSISPRFFHHSHLLLQVAMAVLDEGGGIEHGAVAAGDEFGGQVRAVVHGEQVPSVGHEELARRGHHGEGGGVEAVVVAGSTVGDVPRSGGVVGDLLGGAVVDGRLAVVEVDVAREHQVNAVLEEEGLEGSLAVGAARGADIPRAVAASNNPRGLLSVNRGEILLQPLKLGAVWCEWAGVLSARTTWKIRCVGEVGLRVELDVVDHSVVPRVPKVSNSSRLRRRHAFRGKYRY